MATIPESTKTSLRQRLSTHAAQRWPALARVQIRYRAGFAYIDAILPNADVQRLCRLRYAGYANQWGFAIYRASHDDYEDSYLPTGSMGGTAEDALDTACGLYLGDPTASGSAPVDRVRALQHALYRAAKADPGRRFHSLRDKVFVKYRV